MATTATQVRIPKPAFLPSGCAKTTTRDFSGFERCITCGRTTDRADCRGKVSHVHPDGECCVGMLVVTATWAPRSVFEAEFHTPAGDGLVSTSWAVCPTCIEEA